MVPLVLETHHTVGPPFAWSKGNRLAKGSESFSQRRMWDLHCLCPGRLGRSDALGAAGVLLGAPQKCFHLSMDIKIGLSSLSAFLIFSGALQRGGKPTS